MAPHIRHDVNFATPGNFVKVLKAHLGETLLPDDPFNEFKNELLSIRSKKTIQCFVPIFGWLPRYSLGLFNHRTFFVPPFIYVVFGNSKHLAVGTVAAASLLIAAMISEAVSPTENPELCVSLVITSTLISGLVQTALDVLRMGILVDFLPHSTILGFMGGTAVIICLQQLKGMLGLQHFTTDTDVSVLKAVIQKIGL